MLQPVASPDLLAACPGLRLLVRSREVLNLREEWSYSLGGLPVPAAGTPAGDLERVARASSALLASLVDKSLLRRDSGGRYQVHELLRQYADIKTAC